VTVTGAIGVVSTATVAVSGKGSGVGAPSGYRLAQPDSRNIANNIA
jgi:hypothetical protein